MAANTSMTMLAGLAIAGLVGGAAAVPAEAQCYTSSYYYAGAPVVVAPAPVYMAPAPVYVAPAPVVYHRPAYYVTTHVGYSGGYPRWHHYRPHYRHGHYRHRGHCGRSWGFGFHFGRH
jgi:hypothetical protein